MTSLHWTLLASLCVAITGCTTDALYTFCENDDQCDARTYELDDETELTVYLDCVEVAVEVRADRGTLGRLCTLPCDSRRDCDSFIGLRDGACIRWEGDEEAFCYQRCGDGTACYPSSTCETVVLDDGPLDVCLPERIE